MASRSEEDFFCPICQDIFKDPVVLSCSHSFCKECLQKWWKTKQSRECPCCNRRSSRTDPPRNLALKNLSEAFALERQQQRSSGGSENLCGLHSEKLRLFCLDHQQPVCVVCRDSKIHSGHKFRPIDEAAEEKKRELEKLLKPLKEKLETFKEVKENCDQTAGYIKVQAQGTERRIRAQFKKLHKFLQDEEEARISALKSEEQQKSQRMKEKIEALSRDIAALTDAIKAVEKELRGDDVSFLKSYKDAVMKVQPGPKMTEQEVGSGALINEVKHLGNLIFNVWKKMKGIASFSPVILDPNTADPELLLSDDLTSVRSAERQQLPKNPERVEYSCSVLGSEGFSSGAHVWEVSVGSNKDWELGVLGGLSPQSGLWRIMFSSGNLTAFSTLMGSEKDLSVEKQPQKIRVLLNFDKGKLLFTDADTNTPIYTFTQAFTGTLYPYIYTENRFPLKILPIRFMVQVLMESPAQEQKVSGKGRTSM